MDTSKWGHIGAAILVLTALISSFTENRNYLINVFFILVGLCLIGWDAYKKGKLKQFLWFHIIYILVFAILIYLQLNGMPWG